MPVQIDPEGFETAHVHEFLRPANAHVLEIGCGEGRLTWRYALAARRVVGVDLDAVRVQTAMRECPTALSTRVAFAMADTLALPFPDQVFDGALLAWSL